MKKLFLCCLATSLSLLSSQVQQECDPVLKVLSFNIDTNIIRTEEGYARDSHPEWRIGARIPKIQASLQSIYNQHSPDVIHLQEGRKFTTIFGDEVDSISPLIDFLTSLGYQAKAQQYNDCDRPFSYITAIKKDFTIDGYEIVYLSKTPNAPTDHSNHSKRLAAIKDHNFGEEWERSIFITNFHDKHGRKYRARNIHLGIVEAARYASCDMIRKDSEQAIARDPEVLEVSAGDFNSFPNWGGPKQLAIMAENGTLEEVTKDLRFPNGTKTEHSFYAFPYDFAANEARLNEQSKKTTGNSLIAALNLLPPRTRKQQIEKTFAEECQVLCGQLDRVYQHGFKTSTATLIPTPQFDDFDMTNFNEHAVKDYVLRHHHQGPAFASDHQPILAKLTLPAKK